MTGEPKQARRDPPRLAVTIRVEARDVELAVEVAPGETVALLGPNGAGKSTLLGAIAGLVGYDDGSVTLAGRRLDGVAPHDRGVALLAQDPLLFPHLTALENVAFGPRAAGIHRREARALARHELEAVGIHTPLHGRRPAGLSGGQGQRVAIARALATDPRVLLLDEPMAALDVEVAPALRQTLRRVLADRTAVIVTHDVLDALLLADRVVVIERGRVVEEGPTRQVLSAPRSAFAARLAGLNLLPGRWDGTALVGDAGIRVDGGVPDAEEPLSPGELGCALFSPAAVGVFPSPPGGSPRNSFPVTLTDLEPVGAWIRVRGTLRSTAPRDDREVTTLAAELTPSAVAELGLVPGAEVTFTVKATEVTIYGTFQPYVGADTSDPSR